MNVILTKRITKKLATSLTSMIKDKDLSYVRILMKLSKQLWPTLEEDYHQMNLDGMNNNTLHEKITKGHIVLIPKEGNSQDLDYYRHVTVLTSVYKIYVKALQLKLQLM